MKKLLLITIMLFCGGFMFAQTIPPPVVTPAAPRPATPQRNSNLPPPAAVRTVSGIVKDSTDSTLPGAVVKLVSAKDTLSTSTNVDGIFIFKNVKEATFTLTVSSLGYRTQMKKLLNNDVPTRLTLDPVVLKSESKQLNEVVINGTPSIVYKVDTVEYRATDYKVRPNATLDELLKKMEGMEVASDGSSVTHNGEAITSVKLNGKTYAGGDVKQVITNLPAEILEKVQVVDDYGDQAARTGIKSGDPKKILNVTTKADRSVGTTGRLIGQGGNNERYKGNIYASRLNANQNITLVGDISKTVTGVGGGNPGTARNIAPAITYRDQFGPKVQINTNARYGGNNLETISQSYGFTKQRGNQITGTGQSNFSRNGSQVNNDDTGGASFELEYSIDSVNFLQIRPNYNYSTSEDLRTSFNDQYTVFQNIRPEHMVTSGSTTSKSPTNGFGTTVFFNHRFQKPRRNISLQVEVNRNNSDADGVNDSKITFYGDETLNNPLPLRSDPSISDSIVRLYNTRRNVSNSFRVSSTYSEPLGTYAQFEFNGQVNRDNNNSSSVQDTLLANGELQRLDRLSNIFNYVTTEGRFNFNYRYQGTKVNFSLGTTLVPYSISGNKLDQNIQQNAATDRSFFRALPIARFSYAWSRTQRFNVSYTGNYSKLNFTQIQPFVDRSNINNIVIGNPDLNPTFTNTISAQYSNYFPNSRFNISFNANANFISDQTVTNSFTRIITGGTAPTRTYREQYFVNISGARSYGGNYDISKQLADRRYNLNLRGSVNYDYSLAMDNGQQYHQTRWSFNERMGPRINPVDNVEINPFIGTSLTRTYSTQGDGLYSQAVQHSLGLNGRFYFLKTYQINYDASKRLTTQVSNGLPNTNNSPLIINGGMQKEFGAKRQFTVTLDVFDLLKQNNYLQQNVSATGTTNTITNTESRYFLLGFRLNVQRWSGTPKRNGQNMQRRNDGSFIYK